MPAVGRARLGQGCAVVALFAGLGGRAVARLVFGVHEQLFQPPKRRVGESAVCHWQLVGADFLGTVSELFCCCCCCVLFFFFFY